MMLDWDYWNFHGRFKFRTNCVEIQCLLAKKGIYAVINITILTDFIDTFHQSGLHDAGQSSQEITYLSTPGNMSKFIANLRLYAVRDPSDHD